MDSLVRRPRSHRLPRDCWIMWAMNNWLRPETALPQDHGDAVLVGRVWRPGVGPTLVRIDGADVQDLSGVAPTSSQLMELDDPAAAVRAARGLPRLGSTAEILASSAADARNDDLMSLLAPCDLQAVKAS